MSAQDPPRLVVVHHRADRTRETVALIDLVAWLVDAGGRRVEVLLMNGGPLVAEFEARAPTTVVADLDRHSRDGRAERLAFALRRRSAGFRLRSRRLGLDDWGPGDAVYLHTVLGVQVLRYLPSDRPAGRPAVLCRIAADVHPLRHPLQPGDLTLLLREVDRFLPVTPVGHDELVDEYDVDPARVQTVPELFVPADERLGDLAAARARRRAELGIADDVVVIGSFVASDAGVPDLGVILWSMLARRRGEGRPLALVWGFRRTEAGFWMEHDLRQTGLDGGTHALHVSGPIDDHLDVCDVVVLLSRAEHPLAYLQAAVSGVPVLCFEGNELADLVGVSDRRNVAPFLDVASVAERLLALVASEDDLAEERQAILGAVLDRHGPEAVGRRLVGAAAETGRQR